MLKGVMLKNGYISILGYRIYIVWISTQNLTLTLQGLIDSVFQFSDKHIYKLQSKSNAMIYHKPTKQFFKNRLEARKHFGSGLFNRLIKHTSDFIFINNSTFATNGNTVCSDTKEVS